MAAKALESLGISLEAVRQQVEELIGQGQQAPSGHIPFTPRTKKVIELSLREAQQLGHDYIGTEHILLGLIREGEGVAAQVLVKMGADLNRVRQQVIQLLHGYPGRAPAAASDAPPAAVREGPPARGALRQLADQFRELDARLSALEQRTGPEPGTGHPDLPTLAGQVRELGDEVARLRALLDGHGIKPEDGAA